VLKCQLTLQVIDFERIKKYGGSWNEYNVSEVREQKRKCKSNRRDVSDKLNIQVMTIPIKKRINTELGIIYKLISRKLSDRNEEGKLK